VGLQGIEFEEAGDHARALLQYRKVVELSERLPRQRRPLPALRAGPDGVMSPKTLLKTGLRDVARTLEALYRHQEALPVRRRLVRLGALRGGSNDADEIAQARVDLARTMCHCGLERAALQMVRRAIASIARGGAAATRARITLELQAADLLDRCGRWAEGLQAWVAAKALVESTSGDAQALETCITHIALSRQIVGLPDRVTESARALAQSAPGPAPQAMAPAEGIANPGPGYVDLTGALSVADEAMRLGAAAGLVEAEPCYLKALDLLRVLARRRPVPASQLAARLRVNFGLLLAAAGRHAEAARQLRSAASVLARSRRAGQTARIQDELLAMCGLLAIRQGLSRRVDAGAPPVAARRALARTVRAIDRSLAGMLATPFAPSLGDRSALAILDSLTALSRQIGYLRASALAPRARSAAGEQAYRNWLGLAARVLGEASPEVLLPQAGKLRDSTREALHWRLADTGPRQAADAARWVLHTQGLRAQRDLLASSEEADLQALAELGRQIDEMDRDALGDPQGASAEALAQRRALSWRRDLMRDELVATGRLPPAQVLDLEAVVAELTTGEQLWMLVPWAAPASPAGPPERPAPSLLLLAIRAAAGLPVHECVSMRRLTVPPALDPLSWLDRLDGLCATLAERARGPLRHGPISVGRSADRPPSDGDPVAEWSAALRLCAQGLRTAWVEAGQPARVHLVPAGPALALPWANALRDALAAAGHPVPAVRQHASVAAWKRGRFLRSRAAETAGAPSRVALAVDDGSRAGPDMVLPLVQVEAELSRLLWQERTGRTPERLPPDAPAADSPWPPRLPPERAVRALIGMGHGGVPAGNWARSGLWMPGWPEPEARTGLHRYLDASCLAGLSQVRSLYMSCCILGRTADHLGEPLGLLALASCLNVKVAIGSLLPVEDPYALLISLGFQWSIATDRAGVDWVEAFHGLRTNLQKACWPEGFAAWMQVAIDHLLRGGAATTGSAHDGDRLASLHGLRSIVAGPPPQAVSAACEWLLALG
jgi:hypothetical protein